MKQRLGNEILRLLMWVVLCLCLAACGAEPEAFPQTPESTPSTICPTEVTAADETTPPQTLTQTQPSESMETLPAEEPSQAAPADRDLPETGNDSGGDRVSVTVPQPEEGENLVWVPVYGGTKYHSHAGCSQMEDPIQVTVETAEKNGYTRCGRCW